MIPTTYKAVFEVRNATYTTQANDPNATEWQVEINLGSLMKGDKGDKGDAATITVGTPTATSGTTPAVSVNNSGDEHDAVFDFSFTLPKGDKGDTGNGISNISKTGTAGKVDTYTITYTNTDTDTFTVTNGTDGTNGAAAGFGTPTATVDSNVGTPGVTVSATGPDTAKIFSFAFTNLKGETGDQGPVGRGLEIKGEVVGSWVAPQNPQAGDAYYCTGDGKLHVYDGTSWFTIEMAAGTLDTTAATAQSTNASESLGGSVTLHKIAKTGTYNDLIGKPTIPTVNNANLVVKGAGTAVLSTTANASTDSSVDIVAGSNVTVTPDASAHTITIAATDTTYTSKSAASSGTDLSLVTTGEKYTWNNKSDFSGNYNDLSNKPTIPAAQIQSDWNQTTDTALDYIKNKPTIPTVPGVFSTSANGLVPAASTSGDTDKFLKGDGTWATPAGSSGLSIEPVDVTVSMGGVTKITMDATKKVNWYSQSLASAVLPGTLLTSAPLDIDNVSGDWASEELKLVILNEMGTNAINLTIPYSYGTAGNPLCTYVNGVSSYGGNIITVPVEGAVTIRLIKIGGNIFIDYIDITQPLTT